MDVKLGLTVSDLSYCTMEIGHADLPLIDAHRHGLYDLSQEFTLKGLPVEQWEKDRRFIKHERWTQSLHGTTMKQSLAPWLRYSKVEGVRAVIDFSGKLARSDVASVYKSYGIVQYSPTWWENWTPEIIPSSRVMILPDERGLYEDVVKRSHSFLNTVPDGIITLHAMESPHRAYLARTQWGCSTVEWLDHHNLLTPRTLLVHMNCASVQDLKRIRDRGSHIVYCPAVRLALGNPEPPCITGLKLHFGTDSPLVSGQRSLWAQAVLQYRLWKQAGIANCIAASESLSALVRPLNDNPDVQLAKYRSSGKGGISFSSISMPSFMGAN